ncbi:MAG: hypothetical protein U1E53_23165 [Dongiaceae bacterium]
MLAGRPFTAAGLPGPLDAAGRLVLVRRLLREGALTLCRDPAGDGVEDSGPGRRRGIASARRRR